MGNKHLRAVSDLVSARLNNFRASYAWNNIPENWREDKVVYIPKTWKGSEALHPCYVQW